MGWARAGFWSEGFAHVGSRIAGFAGSRVSGWQKIAFMQGLPSCKGFLRHGGGLLYGTLYLGQGFW